ncbi:MAG: hypothetical protein PVF91_08165 [Chromatiales bacterium]|jgi:hypothetical protein
MRPIPGSLWSRLGVPARTPGAARGRAPLARLARRRPNAALALSLGVLLIGYAFLLAFPVVALLLLAAVLSGLAAPGLSLADLPWLGVALAGSGLAGWVAYATVRLSPGAPSGMPVDDRSALRTRVEEARTLCRAPRVHHVQLVPEHTLRIIRAPRHGLPLVFDNTLQIGLPVLLSGSPQYLRVLLTRSLLDLKSGLRHPAGWGALLGTCWSQLNAGLVRDRHPARRPLQLFFSRYAPLAERVSGVPRRRATLRADHGTLELVNDEEVKDAITRFELVDQVLERVFWPEFYGQAKRHRLPPTGPFSPMGETLARELAGDRLTAHWTRATEAPGDADRASLAERLHAIGHQHFEPPPPVDPDGVRQLLGDQADRLVALFDRAWLAQNSAAWQRRHARIRARLREGLRLQRLAKEHKLGDKECWDFVRLVRRRIRDPDKAVKLYRQALKSRPASPRTLMFIGRMLLASDDAAGVEALARAASLDPELEPAAAGLIARFRDRGAGVAHDGEPDRAGRSMARHPQPASAGP